MKTNPVLIIVGGLGGVVTALLALLVAFGIDVTKDQAAAILGFLGTLTALATAVLTRAKVDSPLTVQKKVTVAARPKHVPAAKPGG